MINLHSSTAEAAVPGWEAERPSTFPGSFRERLRGWLLHPVTQNLGIWILALVPVMMIGFSTGASWENMSKSLTHILLPTCVYYALPIYTHAFLIAPLFTNQRYLLFILLFFLNVLFWTSIIYVIDLSWGAMVAKGLNPVTQFVMVGGFTFLAALIRIARDTVARNHQLRKVELQLLKDQLNPHFLFNTLNNLYGLAVIKSDRLPSLMLQLSELLRYSLYETRAPFVSLEREVHYIRNYIGLESVRLTDRTDVELKAADDFSGYQIAPLLLISFIENCFKHQGSAPGNRGFVRIELFLEQHRLHLHTINSCWSAPSAEAVSASGIGLANARQRLRMLYPGKHTLFQESRDGEYEVRLAIELL